MPIGQVLPGFDLCDHQGVAVERHDVDLAVGASPIAVHNPHSLGFKESYGQRFTVPAEHVFGFHDHLRFQPGGAENSKTGGSSAMWGNSVSQTVWRRSCRA